MDLTKKKKNQNKQTNTQTKQTNKQTKQNNNNKAFDTVDHIFLISNLCKLGIKGIDNSLTARCQSVSINGVLSEPLR